MRARGIKLYGERNTGTNWLEHLIRRNLDVDVLPSVVPEWVRKLQRVVPGTEWLRDLWFELNHDRTLGWKHSRVDGSNGLVERARDRQIGFVCLVKHPAAWVLSLHRRPYDHHWRPVGPLDRFVVSPWYTLRREHAPPVYADPVAMWNDKCAAYLALAERLPETMVLRYEDLVDDPEAHLTAIAARFGVARQAGGFHNDDDSTKTRDERKFNDYRRYYGEERWRGDLPGDVTAQIAARVDQRVLERLGYKPFLA